jgi:hypothetical protein
VHAVSFGGDFEGQPERIKDQAVNLLVSGAVGQGCHRIVYALEHSPDLVMKVEKGHDFANIREWLAWDELQWDPRASRWLAPCVDIDFRTGVLLQRRCRDLSDAEWGAIGKVPAWLGDTKRSNWGWLEDPEADPGGGRPVMRDYAITKLTRLGLGRAGWRLVDKTGD